MCPGSGMHYRTTVASNVEFNSVAEKKKFASLKTILNASKQRQMMQQVMNFSSVGKSTPFEAKLRDPGKPPAVLFVPNLIQPAELNAWFQTCLVMLRCRK